MSANLARQWTHAGTLVPQHLRDRRRPAAVQLRRPAHRLRSSRRTSASSSSTTGTSAPSCIHKNTTDDDRLTRGGPTVQLPGYNFAHFQVSTDPRQRAVFDVTLERLARASTATASYDFSPGVALKPAANIFVQLSPSYNWSQNGAAVRADASTDPTATRVRRQPLRVRLRDDAHAVARDARELDDAPDRDAAALRAALLRQRRLQLVQRVRRAARRRSSSSTARDIGTITRDADDGQLHASTPTARPARRRRSPSATRTSPTARCAARPCCAGSTGPARRCSSSGRSSAPASDAFGDFDFRRDYAVAVRRSAGQRVPGQGDVLAG